MSEQKPRAYNPPQRIWLQVGDIQTDCDFNECGDADVSWCATQVYDTDVEYRLMTRRSAPPKPRQSEDCRVAGDV